MRLSIRHETLHRYAQPVKSVIQKLRLTPRNHQGQHVVHWRIDVDVDCRLKAAEDAFGNLLHGFTSDGPHETVTVTAIGEVDTFDTRGVVQGAVERFPPDLYLRATPMTQAGAEARGLAERTIAAEAGELDRLHALLRAMPEPAVPQAQSAAAGASQSQAQPQGSASPLAPGEATAEDLAHLFIACARLMDIPARYVAGYRLPDANATRQGIHGWAEAFVPKLGWVGFDPANGLCPDERYVRVAIGLDSLGAAGMRAAQAGGIEAASETRLSVAEMRPRGHG
ncbi:Transglutaminase-like enzyme, putative cysteine protease [Rhizobiales bacterium GAS188]|nr:Transglutaminase-like enzyme, putative cysteine protease [Rhizobiales bacterium GAS188]